MVNKIEERREENIVYKEESPKRKDIVSNVMIAIVVAILVGIVFAYIAKFEGGFDLSVKNLTANGGLLFLACYSVRYLCKHISMNKARETDDYKKARAEARVAIKEISEKGFSLRIPEYTKAYSDRRYDETVEKILKSANIAPDDYFQKYATKRKREILSDYPDELLSKKQWKAIKEANSVKRLYYDEKFLETETERIDGYISPSDAFDVGKEDKKDDLHALLMSAALVVFSCSLAGTIIIDLSNRAVILAIIKIITTLFSAALAISKGWDLIMKKEVGRFNLQTRESRNCIEWCEKNPTRNNKDEKGAA